MWDRDKYVKAWRYAGQAHNGQRVPGSDLPYINHIGNVAMEAMATIAHDNGIERPDLLIQCALLHDVIEDTDTTYAIVREEFGAAVADGVLALTKNADLPNKKERMADSLRRIKEQPAEIWMVKMADRITNLQPPPGHWSPPKIKNYHDEAISIWENLHPANPYLADRLQSKISQYECYL
ncbi:MAG: HD domain-containing protein [Candidatus Latescibacteria bacterium]|nr:HD domain-containing protein [Candidatus Latescibacterota bacterium]